MPHTSDIRQSEDFLETQTSTPSPSEDAEAERLLGYSLPRGGKRVHVETIEDFTVKQTLLHPARAAPRKLDMVAC